MASTSPLKLCATCETVPAEQKPKSGILLCTGCQKYFCSQHTVQHRQYLTDLLENEVVNKRNALQEKFSTSYEQQLSAGIREKLETINKWELEITELIKESAACARKQLQEISLKEYENLQKQFTLLSDKLNALREQESYFENDVDQLKNKFQQLKHDIEHFPIELSINKIPNELVLVKSIVQSAPPPAPTYYFVDQLLTSQQPKISIDLSAMKIGRMCPIGDQLIAFYSENELPALNIDNNSWQSL
ncbi:unnamed protein product, partial [Rotaria sp. Silwood1]